MPHEEEGPPSPYFGDYPNGAYWSAIRPEGWVEPAEEDVHVTGTVIRFFYDEARLPLWDDGGLLPDEPAWLQRELGISASLVADLVAWCVAIEELRFDTPDPYEHARREAWVVTELDRLVSRLRDELHPHLTVTVPRHPW